MNPLARAFNAVGGRILARTGRVALLGTTGARSGRARTAPVGYLRRADGSVIIGAGGTGRAWAANLRAHPACTLAIRGRGAAYTAEALEGAARDAALAELVASMPERLRGATWADVFLLHPAPAAQGDGAGRAPDAGDAA
jgi:deazaflavin-dependent oxidoreductase (nitroreductase family)